MLPRHPRLCRFALLLAAGLLPALASAFTEAELRSAATRFPAMPTDTFSMSQLLGRPATFSSGGPFNDLEFTVFDTDYIDGENGGFDTFLPVDPGQPNPGANTIKYVRTALNTDLNDRYTIARADRVILGSTTAGPFFLRGPDGLDNDYAVIQHFDFRFGAIELAGRREDYALAYCTQAQGCRTEGWFLFHIAAAQPDLVAFVHRCNAIAPAVSGNPPANLNPLCNASTVLSLDDPVQFRWARAVGDSATRPEGVLQFGGPGKDLLGGVTRDGDGNLYFVGNTDSVLDGRTSAPNSIFVMSTSPDGHRRWVYQLPMEEGTTLKGVTTDDEFVYACGRTLGELPGFRSAGRWDGILLKLRRSDGTLVASQQWGNAGIDGYGSCILDDSGHLFLSGQGSAAGPATTDDLYLVAKHRKSDLQPVWVALPRPPVGGFVASSEAWGRLAYRPGTTPGAGRLAVSGWYMGPGGAEAFLAIFEDLDQAQPRVAHSLVLGSQPNQAEWILGAVFDSRGRIHVAGYTTGDIGGPQAGEGDLFLIRYESDLTGAVRRQFGTPRSEWTRTFGIDAQDRLYVIGNSFGDLAGLNADRTQGSGDAFVAVFDTEQRLLRQAQYGSGFDDRALGVVGNGEVVLAGVTEGSLVDRNAGSFDIHAVRLDAATLATAAAPSRVDADQFDLSGAWFEPETAGQGLVIEMIESRSRGVGQPGYLFAGWFTYDSVAGGADAQAWYALEGTLTPGSSRVELSIGRTAPGRFDAGPAVAPQSVGRAVLRIESCTRATLEYRFDASAGGRSGQVKLQRLMANVACEDGAAPRVANAPASFAASGGWFTPATAGQGLVMEFNPASNVLFGAWYTYSASGGDHRWFTLQAEGVGADQTRFNEVTVFETTRGRFDLPDPTTIRPVGTASWRLIDCGNAELDYRFTSGELAGRSGTQRLQRLGPPPLECRSP